MISVSNRFSELVPAGTGVLAGILLLTCVTGSLGCAGRTGGRSDLLSEEVCELPIIVADSMVASTFSDSLRYPIGDGVVAYYQKGQTPNWVVDYVWFRMSGTPRRDLYTMAQMDSLVTAGVGSDSMRVQWVTYRVGVAADSYDDLKTRAIRDRPKGPPAAVLNAVNRFDKRGSSD